MFHYVKNNPLICVAIAESSLNIASNIERI